MKIRLVPVRWAGVILVAVLAGCSAVNREHRQRSVAVVISPRGGVAPSATDIEQVYAVLQPEFKKYGYVLATNPRLADFVVYVRDPADPLGSDGGRITFVRVPANERIATPMAAANEFKIASERTNREMTREPKD